MSKQIPLLLGSMETVVFNLILVFQIILFGKPSNLCWPVHTVQCSVSIGLGCRNAVLLDGGRDPCGTWQGGGGSYQK